MELESLLIIHQAATGRDHCSSQLDLAELMAVCDGQAALVLTQ